MFKASNTQNDKDLDAVMKRHKDLCEQAKHLIQRETKIISEAIKQKLKSATQ